MEPDPQRSAVGDPRQPQIINIGVDLGQKVDPTAIAIVEQQLRPIVPGLAVDHYVVRDLARLPLGTPYPDVAAKIAEVVRRLRPRRIWYDRRPLPSVRLYADATGVGQPVVDLLHAADVPVTAVYFTHGDKRTEEAGAVKLGKAWLVSRLQALLQTNRLHLPDTEEARQLAKELQDYEIRVDQDANDRYGAFKVGTHDDLVTALGLAVQEARSPGDPGVWEALDAW